jgi:hygromycin-B 7''-O-kinase
MTPEEVLREIWPSVVVSRVQARTGGQNSAVYEVHTAEPARRLIIKSYPPELTWKLHKEIHVYGLLAGVPVPQVVHSGEDFLVLTLLDGVPLSTVSGELEPAQLHRIYHRLGRLLRRIHGVTPEGFGYIGTGVIDPLPTNAEYMAGRFAHKLAEFTRLGGDPGLRDRVESWVAERADLLALCPAPVLCHNDYYEGNILVARGEVTGVVDMENALAGDPVLDIAKTEYYSIHGDENKLDALLAGYGDPPAGWPETLPLYRVYHVLELWDWFALIGEVEHLPGLTEDLRRYTSG